MFGLSTKFLPMVVQLKQVYAIGGDAGFPIVARAIPLLCSYDVLKTVRPLARDPARKVYQPPQLTRTKQGTLPTSRRRPS
eukprot:4398073-Pleurochrysis_carterae.AAC.1